MRHITSPIRHLPSGTTTLIILLLIIISGISFVYADGLVIIQKTWLSLTTPKLTFHLQPEKDFIPADGSSQVYIDVQIKNAGAQLISGDDILVRITQGQTDLTKDNQPPADISKRIFLRAPETPQIITLEFKYKHLSKTINIEAFDPTPPAMPVLQSPAPDANLTTATPTISGSIPLQTRVEIYIDGSVNTVAEADEDGNFKIPLKLAIKNGPHKLSLATLNKYNLRSSFTTSITINVKAPDPEIDILNLRIKPNPVKANTSFQFLIPVSTGTKSVALILDAHNYPLRDTNNSSVFSGIIPAPTQPGLYRLSLMITSESGDNVIVEKVASIQVI